MEFTLKTTFDASPEEVYAAWLSAAGHTKMTGGEALISDQVGETFSAWDFYITGVNLELEVNKRIVQTWRTTEFEEAEEDSRIEILLREHDGQTELTLIHTNLPAHGSQYKEGWEEHYFKPMKKYFISYKNEA